MTGAVSGHDADAVLAQIEETREDLARTIDTLADRVSPASNLRRLRERASEQLSRPEVGLAAAAAGVALVGLTVVWLWARNRRK